MEFSIFLIPFYGIFILRIEIKDGNHFLDSRNTYGITGSPESAMSL